MFNNVVKVIKGVLWECAFAGIILLIGFIAAIVLR